MDNVTDNVVAIVASVTALIASITALITAIISLLRAQLCVKMMGAVRRGQQQLPGEVVQAIAESPQLGSPGTIDPTASSKMPRPPDVLP